MTAIPPAESAREHGRITIPERLAYSPAEAAEALGISRPTLYNTLLNRPGFPVFRVGGRVLISTEGLREWVRRQAEGGEENG